MEPTILDRLFAEHALRCRVRPIRVSDNDLVHVVGAQEPVRDQPDAHSRDLLNTGWLTVELIDPGLPEAERGSVVTALQQSARAWLKGAGDAAAADKEQARWLFEKTRSHESKQQIAQRVWLALVIYSQGERGLRFDGEGDILWQGGETTRIGVSPDAVIETAWAQENHATYAASFRQPDGTIVRGKGRHRWHTYRLTVAPDAAFLFERYAAQEHQTIALIVASETFASLPQLPRSFYGGDAFQQACIDAQDQQMAQILVLSPEHGILSLDDVVPSECVWDDLLDGSVWEWVFRTTGRLAAHLFGRRAVEMIDRPINWWAWLNPASTYEIVVYGAGFPVDFLFDFLPRLHRTPENWASITPGPRRPGYDAGEFDSSLPFNIFLSDDDYDDYDSPEDEIGSFDDLEALLAWANDFVTLVSIHTVPTDEVITLGADEALIPVRLLAQAVLDMDDLLDLLTDMSLLLEQPVPFSMLLGAPTLVSTLLQVTHSLVHGERSAIPEVLDSFPSDLLRQYVETVMQEPTLEDQLCGCLTLAEQAQLLAISIPQEIVSHLATWLQTYLSARLRRDMLGDQPPVGR